ncbi:hypothetical protein C8R43DRAFT_1140610 [Mycena crocata]|nr:hypothetical protein C8R43DRAFT_1140610 [Mycena crocata]
MSTAIPLSQTPHNVPRVSTMARSKKPKPSEEVVKERRAQAAWEYRQRNPAAINEKARLRMRDRREALRTAPSGIQLLHAVKARQYRRNYIERNKEIESVAALPPQKAKAKKTAEVAPPASKTSKAFVKTPKPRPHTSAPPARMKTPIASPSTPSRVKARHPRSLAEIDRSDSEAEEQDSWWDEPETNENEQPLGPLLNATGHPDYVPEPGQQPYIRGGRRYWM